MIYNILLLYYIAINVVLFVVMGIDKYKAKRHLWRIPESALFSLSFLGGSIGGFFGMFCFRHKIRKYYFYIERTQYAAPEEYIFYAVLEDHALV